MTDFHNALNIFSGNNQANFAGLRGGGGGAYSAHVHTGMCQV